VGTSDVDGAGGTGGFDSVGGQSVYGAQGLDEVLLAASEMCSSFQFLRYLYIEVTCVSGCK
jgi:hypothetical protein